MPYGAKERQGKQAKVDLCLRMKRLVDSMSVSPVFPWARAIFLKRILICPQGALTPDQSSTWTRRWIVWSGGCIWDASRAAHPSPTRLRSRVGGTVESGRATKREKGFRNWPGSMASPGSVCGRLSSGGQTEAGRTLRANHSSVEEIAGATGIARSHIRPPIFLPRHIN